MNCAVVIPCRNESAAIAEVVKGARRFIPTVIVVLDGSTDDTMQKASVAGAQCVSLARNCGKGAALLAGFRKARELGMTSVLTMDGDGQHSPTDIPRFLKKAATDGPDLIVGNRMDQAEKMPRGRRIANRMMSRWLSSFAGVFLPDSQCGFRWINLEALREKDLRTRRFEFESEMLVDFARHSRRIEFVPIEVIYKRQRSNIRVLPDTWRWLRWYCSETRSGRFARGQHDPCAIVEPNSRVRYLGCDR
jgi:glycosyltransferase involved in cell wall biosynthesis